MSTRTSHPLDPLPHLTIDITSQPIKKKVQKWKNEGKEIQKVRVIKTGLTYEDAMLFANEYAQSKDIPFTSSYEPVVTGNVYTVYAYD